MACGLSLARDGLSQEGAGGGLAPHRVNTLTIVLLDSVDLRPIRHWTEPRVRAHVLVCMLAAYLVWHLRHVLAPLTFTDEQPPQPTDPVAPATRSVTAQAKASHQRLADGSSPHCFRTLLDHLARVIKFASDGRR